MSDSSRSGETRARPFLTARWEDLVIVNFDCPEELLTPLVPAGTELDPWNGVQVISLVGFTFADTRVRGLSIPGHRTFEEVNLRFYVRREAPDGTVRRGVVFVRELVPRRAIALVARLFYNEPYTSVPMDRHVILHADSGGIADYTWSHGGLEHHHVGATVDGPSHPLVPGSEGEFITEHYWGYTSQRNGTTLEYRVEHPPWRVWAATGSWYRAPSGSTVYPPAFSDVLSRQPRSAFVTQGSEVSVYPGRRVT